MKKAIYVPIIVIIIATIIMSLGYIVGYDANKKIGMQVSLRNGDSSNPITNQVNAVNVCSNIYIATLTTVSDFANLGIHQVIYFHGAYPKATGD